MRALSAQEKRTVRFAAIVIGIYLVLYGGYQLRQFLEVKRADYLQVVKQADDLKKRIQPYEGKVENIKTLMEAFHLDPSKLTRATVIGEASAAIQKTAASSGIQVGQVSEPQSRASSRELNLVMEGVGPVQAVVGLINRLETTGYPLIIESVQITAEASRPGQLRVKLTISILDFEQWKGEAPRA
jgi:hypothetical protein